jgi:HEPN domain-containing protein
MSEPTRDFESDVKTWLQYAHSSYSASRSLFDEALRPGYWFPAALLGHHALELYLKAALLRRGHRIEPGDVWGHDLVELAQELEKEVPDFPPLMDSLEFFDRCFAEFRYPTNDSRLLELGQEEGILLQKVVEAIRPYSETCG